MVIQRAYQRGVVGELGGCEARRFAAARKLTAISDGEKGYRSVDMYLSNGDFPAFTSDSGDVRAWRACA
jgi:hypothetical protein